MWHVPFSRWMGQDLTVCGLGGGDNGKTNYFLRKLAFSWIASKASSPLLRAGQLDKSGVTQGEKDSASYERHGKDIAHKKK